MRVTHSSHSEAPRSLGKCGWAGAGETGGLIAAYGGSIPPARASVIQIN